MRLHELWISNYKNLKDFRINFDADSPITVIRPYLVDRLSWQEVLDRFGEPSGISTFGGRGPDIDSPVVFDVIVVYAEQGLVLYTDGLRHPPVLSPALRFDNISLYAAPLDDLGAVLPYFKLYPEHLRPWEGFQDFLYYCPVEDNPDCLADN